MTADLLTLDDIAAMHHCSIRHARDVLARISGHRDISLLHRVYYRATADEIARGVAVGLQCRRGVAQSGSARGP